MSEEISVSGRVRGFDLAPIPRIQVTLYRDTRQLDRAYTDEEGAYSISVPKGAPITVRFDTHWSLTNARDWHPSVIANVDASKDVVLDRHLMRVGTVENETSAVDALAAYQFCAIWADGESDGAYAEYAAYRLSQMKLATEVLREVQQRLEAHFGGRG